MKTSYAAIGLSMSRLFRLLAQNNFFVHPRYFLRLLLLLQGAVWSSVFKVVEKARHDKKINALPPPEKPVFIIGHWRTGSTLLHQLMSLDDQFVTPNVFQVTVPDCFVSIEKYYKPVMQKMMEPTRPMDNVKFGPEAPQEDEFALFRLTLQSPIRRIIFPQKCSYFLTDDKHFIEQEHEMLEWEKALMYFYKKLIYKNQKRILIKNPFHSMRIQTLLKLFPDAVFIYIYRNPFDVIPSTIRMWNIIARQNCMNTNWSVPDVSEVASLYARMLNVIENELSVLPAERRTAVKYETLVASPQAEIARIYNELGLTISPELMDRIEKFLDEEKDYQKNVHKLNSSDISIISEALKDFIHRENYRLP